MEIYYGLNLWKTGAMIQYNWDLATPLVTLHPQDFLSEYIDNHAVCLWRVKTRK